MSNLRLVPGEGYDPSTTTRRSPARSRGCAARADPVDLPAVPPREHMTAAPTPEVIRRALPVRASRLSAARPPASSLPASGGIRATSIWRRAGQAWVSAARLCLTSWQFAARCWVARAPTTRKQHRARGGEALEHARARPRGSEALRGPLLVEMAPHPRPVRTQRFADLEVRKRLASCPRANSTAAAQS